MRRLLHADTTPVGLTLTGPSIIGVDKLTFLHRFPPIMFTVDPMKSKGIVCVNAIPRQINYGREIWKCVATAVWPGPPCPKQFY